MSQQSRGNLYAKNLMSPVDAVVAGTSEEWRVMLLNEEEDYFITEYRKELRIREMAKQSRHDFECFDEGSNQGKRRRGAGKRATSGGNKGADRLETTIKNRLFMAALFDTDHEEEGGEEEEEQRGPRAIRHRVTADGEHMEEETMDDQYIDIDDDSNTQHSQVIGMASARDGES